ncbi:uncharacterized protein TRUGW13939_05718 [Talaromyces rugulosus]|uniref:CCHC-type domain-containing protein n=1 Tax=Talaromyces rugulosus TaxID=121627 RepID=A0A7H8R133_TALRU|nr:uncharacterized protein TRUGW13939_05718 [Talaromyces rugulosus]QKX58593.1 hypothetical protein TRUGW13939_05718 [Talaromyces rugulosus]
MVFFKKIFEKPRPTGEGPKSDPGLHDLIEDKEANKAASTVIVAVHGLGGNWLKTWESENDKWNWVQSSIGPRLLEETDVTPRVLSFGYNSDIFDTKSVNDIQSVAQMLVGRLYHDLQMMDNISHKVIFIAHSLGGLVVKKALIVAWNDNDRYGKLLSTIQGCIFLGVPHRGADLASSARLPVRILQALSAGSLGNDKFVKSLRRKSSECEDISRDFIQRAKGLQIRTFHETEKFMNQIIVDRDSAVMNLPNEVVQPLDGSNHQTICKFSRQEEQRYQPVWDALRELVLFGEPNSPIDREMLPSSQNPGRFDYEAQKTQIASVYPHYTQRPQQGPYMSDDDQLFGVERAHEHQNTYSLYYNRQNRRRPQTKIIYRCCKTCGTGMHHTEDCPWLGRDNLRCYTCGSKGHWAKECLAPDACSKFKLLYL